MKTHIKQPQAVSHTIQSKSKAANQADMHSVLQKYAVAQRAEMPDEDELLQGKFDVAQREELDDEEIVQGKFSDTVQRAENSQFSIPNSQLNKTGIPDTMKSGFENMSGFSFDDVRVHYNSDKPAQLQALAYTQGSEVHIAPGQEKHLGHELGHVVQQKQGRVQPTMQMKGVSVNDDEGLEREADRMGERIVQRKLDTIQKYKEGSSFKYSDDESLAITKNTDNSKKFYAKQGTVDEENSRLKVVKLIKNGSITIDSLSLNKTLQYDSFTAEYKGRTSSDMVITSDCGRCARKVMGTENPTGRYYKSRGRYKTSSKDKPDLFKKEIVDKTLGNVDYIEDEKIKGIYKESETFRNEIGTDKTFRKARQVLQTADYDKIYKILCESKTLSAIIGVNEYAEPKVGQGYTISTGGNPIKGEEKNTWNFHWAGVVTESVDKKDKIILENYAVNIGGRNIDNNEWNFDIIGKKKDQSFHEKHKGTKQHGDSPTTMAVGI